MKQAESGAPLQPGATQPEHEGVAHARCRYCGNREHASGTMCPKHPDLLSEPLSDEELKRRISLFKSSVPLIDRARLRERILKDPDLDVEAGLPMTAAHIPLGGSVEHRLYSKAELTTLLERMARLVVEEARAIAETNAGKPGEVIHCQGDVQTFCAGMSESMRRIYKALGILLTPEKLQQLREAVERP